MCMIRFNGHGGGMAVTKAVNACIILTTEWHKSPYKNICDH